MQSSDIELLNDLLKNTQQEAADYAISSRNQSHIAPRTPASFGQSSVLFRPVSTLHDGENDKLSDERATENDPNDSRPEPKYQIYYKKLIGTEDLFLGDQKRFAIFDCSHMVVKIHFESTTRMNDLTLSVTSDRIKVESKEKKLCVYLPETVDDESGDAKWDASTGMLVVTLPLKSKFSTLHAQTWVK